MAWKTVAPELFDDTGQLVAEWCRKIVLEVIGETNWLLTKDACERRQGSILRIVCFPRASADKEDDTKCVPGNGSLTRD